MQTLLHIGPIRRGGESIEEYIFPRLGKVCPWEGTDTKADFFFREKVSLSEIVGKKDRLSNRAEQLSTRAKRGQTAKRS